MKKIKWNKTYNTHAFGESIEISHLVKKAGMCTFKLTLLDQNLCNEYESNIYHLAQVGGYTFVYMDNNEWRGHIIYDIQDIEDTETVLMEDNGYTYKEAHIIASALNQIAQDNFNI